MLKTHPSIYKVCRVCKYQTNQLKVSKKQAIGAAHVLTSLVLVSYEAASYKRNVYVSILSSVAGDVHSTCMRRTSELKTGC